MEITAKPEQMEIMEAKDNPEMKIAMWQVVVQDTNLIMEKVVLQLAEHLEETEDFPDLTQQTVNPEITEPVLLTTVEKEERQKCQVQLAIVNLDYK